MNEMKAYECLKFMIARCDGAKSEDGQGFNRSERDFARSLHEQLLRKGGFSGSLSEKQLVSLVRMLSLYKGQLAGLVDKDEDWTFFDPVFSQVEGGYSRLLGAAQEKESLVHRMGLKSVSSIEEVTVKKCPMCAEETPIRPDALEWIKSRPEGVQPYIERIVLEDKTRSQSIEIPDGSWFKPQPPDPNIYGQFYGPYFLGDIQRPRRSFLREYVVQRADVLAAVELNSRWASIPAEAFKRCFESWARRSLEEQQHIQDVWSNRVCHAASERGQINIDNFTIPENASYLLIEGILPVPRCGLVQITSVILRWQKETGEVRLGVSGFSTHSNRDDTLSVFAHRITRSGEKLDLIPFIQ